MLKINFFAVGYLIIINLKQIKSLSNTLIISMFVEEVLFSINP